MYIYGEEREREREREREKKKKEERKRETLEGMTGKTDNLTHITLHFFPHLRFLFLTFP